MKLKKDLYLNKFILIFINFFFILYFTSYQRTKNNIKIALCTVGKKENLYANEFIEYYIKLGFDHLFIYDDNEPNTEKISNIINPLFRKYVTIYDNLNDETKYQAGVYNNCYRNNNKQFDWLLMIDMDEFLFIKKNKIKDYLTKNRSLFKRFKGPYIKSGYVKSMIRGNISNLKFMVHSPYESPEKNIIHKSNL